MNPNRLQSLKIFVVAAFTLAVVLAGLLGILFAKVNNLEQSASRLPICGHYWVEGPYMLRANQWTVSISSTKISDHTYVWMDHCTNCGSVRIRPPRYYRITSPFLSSDTLPTQ